jgi:hypothetical protein
MCAQLWKNKKVEGIDLAAAAAVAAVAAPVWVTPAPSKATTSILLFIICSLLSFEKRFIRLYLANSASTVNKIYYIL